MYLAHGHTQEAEISTILALMGIFLDVVAVHHVADVGEHFAFRIVGTLLLVELFNLCFYLFSISKFVGKIGLVSITDFAENLLVQSYLREVTDVLDQNPFNRENGNTFSAHAVNVLTFHSEWEPSLG